jgi:hypothetical protein
LSGRLHNAPDFVGFIAQFSERKWALSGIQPPASQGVFCGIRYRKERYFNQEVEMYAKKWFVFGALALFAVLAAACSGPVEDCLETQKNEVCVSVKPKTAAEPTATAPAAPDDDDVSDDDVITCTDGMAMLAIPEGKTVTVKAGCRVSGDIVVNGVTLYDDKAETGLLVDFRQEATVFAQWGASVNADSVDTWVTNMKASGCTGECQSVTVLTWPR